MKNISAASMFLVFKHEVQQCKERKMIWKYYSFLLKFLYLYLTVIEYIENQYTDYLKSYIQYVNKFKSQCKYSILLIVLFFSSITALYIPLKL